MMSILESEEEPSEIVSSSYYINDRGQSFRVERPNNGPMTRSRRIARFLSRYAWYHPERHNKNVCLDKGWSYYENAVLPRRYFDNVENDPYEKATPGTQDRPTALYPLCTPLDEMADFGIGVGMYFATLRALIVISLIVGCVHIPLMLFYMDDNYKNGDSTGNTLYFREPDILLQIIPFLRLSALCQSTEFVPCPTCNAKDWEESVDKYVTIPDINEIQRVFVERTLCTPDYRYGWVSLGAIVTAMLLFALLGIYQGKIEVRFDENEQTAQDYSIFVTNVPSHVYSAQSYRSYFEKLTNKKVTCVSIALDNDKLLLALTARRKLYRRLQWLRNENDREFYKQKVSSLQNSKGLGWLEAFQERRIIAKITEVEENLDSLLEMEYKVVGVYVTFEQEAGQRRALEALSGGLWEELGLPRSLDGKISNHDIRWRQNLARNGIPKFYEKTLYCSESPEPSSVIWAGIGTKFLTRLRQRIITILSSIGIIVMTGFVVSILQEYVNSYVAVLSISVSNAIVPSICKALTLDYERHIEESSSQISVFLKVTLVRWANTAILIYALTPNQDTIRRGDDFDLLQKCSTLFLSEIFLIPMLRIADIRGFLHKHILAPRCKNQDKLMFYFTGTKYFIGDLYADATKNIFMAFFYSVIFPQGFLLCFVSLFIYYWTDKFCVMYVWKPAAFSGTSLTKFARKYMFSFAIVGFSLFVTCWWSGFKFDNLCSCSNESSGCDIVYPSGTYINEYVQIELSDNSQYFYFCNQSFIKQSKYPILPSIFDTPWMSDGQELMTEVLGWFSIGVLLITSMIVVGNDICNAICSSFKSDDSTNETKDQYIDFSCINGILAYVPQIHDPEFLYPLLACSISNIDQKLIGWKDEEEGFDYWNLIYDYPHERLILFVTSDFESSDIDETYNSKGKLFSRNPCFSLVHHYPPSWTSEIEHVMDK